MWRTWVWCSRSQHRVVVVPIGEQLVQPQPQPTFPPIIQETTLAAPVTVPKPPVVAPVTGTNVAPVQPVAAVGQVSASPFVLNNVTVTISDTEGFARDAGLLKAARQNLPTVLQALGLPLAQAQSTAKTVGDPLKFVARYAVVSERLLPVYTLVVNLTFNELMLRSNFGGAKVQAVSATVVRASDSVVAGPVQVWQVMVPGDDVRVVEALRAKLAAEPGTQVVYATIAAREVVFQLTTALPLTELTAWLAKAGWQAAPLADAAALSLRPLTQ